MTIAERLQNEFVKIGYSSIRQNYVFSDVFSSPPLDRTAEVAAFTHTPPSYRNAALALVSDIANRATDQLVSEYRALGAPLVFVVEGSQVSVWQVRSQERPRLIAGEAQTISRPSSPNLMINGTRKLSSVRNRLVMLIAPINSISLMPGFWWR